MTTSSRLRALLSASAALLLPGVIHAQGATPAASANASGKEYVLARKSSFETPPASQRNPFWPIGWTPTATGPAEAPALDVQAEDFRVTSTSVDFPPLAVINGRTYGVGEQVPITGHPGETVTVRQILDGMVVLDYRGHPLKAISGLSPRAAR